MKYLKTIYDNFDFSTVPYKKDYYEYVARSLWQRAVTMMKTPHQEL